MKRKTLLMVILIGLAAASCGVKSDLARPDGKPAPQGTADPSKPPNPLGR